MPPSQESRPLQPVPIEWLEGVRMPPASSSPADALTWLWYPELELLAICGPPPREIEVHASAEAGDAAGRLAQIVQPGHPICFARLEPGERTIASPSKIRLDPALDLGASLQESSLAWSWHDASAFDLVVTSWEEAEPISKVFSRTRAAGDGEQASMPIPELAGAGQWVELTLSPRRDGAVGPAVTLWKHAAAAAVNVTFAVERRRDGQNGLTVVLSASSRHRPLPDLFVIVHDYQRNGAEEVHPVDWLGDRAIVALPLVKSADRVGVVSAAGRAAFTAWKVSLAGGRAPLAAPRGVFKGADFDDCPEWMPRYRPEEMPRHARQRLLESQVPMDALEPDTLDLAARRPGLAVGLARSGCRQLLERQAGRLLKLPAALLSPLLELARSGALEKRSGAELLALHLARPQVTQGLLGYPALEGFASASGFLDTGQPLHPRLLVQHACGNPPGLAQYLRWKGPETVAFFLTCLEQRISPAALQTVKTELDLDAAPAWVEPAALAVAMLREPWPGLLVHRYTESSSERARCAAAVQEARQALQIGARAETIVAAATALREEVTLLVRRIRSLAGSTGASLVSLDPLALADALTANPSDGLMRLRAEEARVHQLASPADGEDLVIATLLNGAVASARARAMDTISRALEAGPLASLRDVCGGDLHRLEQLHPEPAWAEVARSLGLQSTLESIQRQRAAAVTALTRACGDAAALGVDNSTQSVAAHARRCVELLGNVESVLRTLEARSAALGELRRRLPAGAELPEDVGPERVRTWMEASALRDRLFDQPSRLPRLPDLLWLAPRVEPFVSLRRAEESSRDDLLILTSSIAAEQAIRDLQSAEAECRKAGLTRADLRSSLCGELDLRFEALERNAPPSLVPQAPPGDPTICRYAWLGRVLDALSLASWGRELRVDSVNLGEPHRSLLEQLLRNHRLIPGEET